MAVRTNFLPQSRRHSPSDARPRTATTLYVARLSAEESFMTLGSGFARNKERQAPRGSWLYGATQVYILRILRPFDAGKSN